MKNIDPKSDAAAIDDAASPLQRRLAGLKTMPIEISRLRHAIEAEIPRPRTERPLILRLFSPVQAVAASLLVGVVVVFMVLASSSGPAMASPERMASVYHSMVADHSSQTVGSFSEAEQVLRKQWADLPAVPGASMGTAMSCCIHEVAGRRMACVSVKLDDAIISIATAPASNFTVPKGQTRLIDGQQYLVESANGVNMVMTERSGIWVCVMSSLDTESLIAFVERLKW